MKIAKTDEIISAEKLTLKDKKTISNNNVSKLRISFTELTKISKILIIIIINRYYLNFFV